MAESKTTTPKTATDAKVDEKAGINEKDAVKAPLVPDLNKSDDETKKDEDIVKVSVVPAEEEKARPVSVEELKEEQEYKPGDDYERPEGLSAFQATVTAHAPHQQVLSTSP